MTVRLRLIDSPENLRRILAQDCPDIAEILAPARAIGPGQGKTYDYHAMALFLLAQQYNHPGAHMLEIGTLWGHTAAVLALAAPEAHVLTVNTNEEEVVVARQKLACYTNVEVRCVASWSLLQTYVGPELDLIWVDGDHKHIARDVPWFRWLLPGGLIVFHDYSGPDSYTPSGVFWILNACCAIAERSFDVLIMNDRGEGMAGWYKLDCGEQKE